MENNEPEMDHLTTSSSSLADEEKRQTSHGIAFAGECIYAGALVVVTVARTPCLLMSWCSQRSICHMQPVEEALSFVFASTPVSPASSHILIRPHLNQWPGIITIKMYAN